jgi:hypothetical protein
LKESTARREEQSVTARIDPQFADGSAANYFSPVRMVSGAVIGGDARPTVTDPAATFAAPF